MHARPVVAVVPLRSAMPKARRPRGSGPGPALPLAEQILQEAAPRPTAREKRRGGGEEEEEEGYVDARLSRRILQQARRQQEELEAEHGPGAPAAPKQRSTALGEPPVRPPLALPGVAGCQAPGSASAAPPQARRGAAPAPTRRRMRVRSGPR